MSKVLQSAFAHINSIKIENQLWDLGFSGEQSAEQGPIMHRVRKLMAEAFLAGHAMRARSDGLRAQAAVAAIQGYLINDPAHCLNFPLNAEYAVRQADALISELEK